MASEAEGISAGNLGRSPREIWIFNHYAGFPETVPATRTFELAGQLTSKGWNVTVIACSFNHYSFVDDFPATRERVHEVHRDGVRWVYIKGRSYRGNGLARFANMIDYAVAAFKWSRTQRPPSIVIGTTVHPFAADAARRVAKRHKTTFFYEITDLWPESLVDLGHLGRRSLMYRLLRRMERRAFDEASGVIGVPPGVGDYAMDAYGIRIENFCYLPNGTADLAKDAPKVVPDPGSVAYAGGFAPAHGMPTIVRAAARLESEHPGRFTIHLYGDGPMRPDLQSLAANLRAPNVMFHGLVPKPDLHAMLSRSKICLCTGEPLPVHRYGISFNKLFDYFRAARPVVFAVDSSNDPVNEAHAGISVKAGDDAAIAAAIVTLDDMEPDELQKMGDRGLEFLRREHSFDELGARLHDFLVAFAR